MSKAATRHSGEVEAVRVTVRSLNFAPKAKLMGFWLMFAGRPRR